MAISKFQEEILNSIHEKPLTFDEIRSDLCTRLGRSSQSVSGSLAASLAAMAKNGTVVPLGIGFYESKWKKSPSA